MIPRALDPHLRQLATYYPVVAVTGPRQSGKTTLCRAVFPDHPYVSLETLDTRDFARDDPRGFLAQYRQGAVLDEIQRVPELLSYLQTEVDERPEVGRFVLTGSQHLGLSEAIAQSLAGRCGLLTLLPPSLSELRAFPNTPDDLWTLLWQGSYPRIYDRAIPAHQWLGDYLATYIQRDVRQIINVGDLQSFMTFVRLCAGRSGQEINLSALGADAGVSHNTARAWLSVLETSFVLHRLPAWHANVRKQIVKAPKLHLFDSGLLCYLLGMREPEQLQSHPLRGAIFESWVVAEVYKGIVHSGQRPNLFHYRESRGIELDLLIENGLRLDRVEIKSGATIASDFFRNLKRFPERPVDGSASDDQRAFLVYGGDSTQQRSDALVLSWRDVGRITTP
ncbi:ATP-binding protein [Halochromatium roseum]|uniref:ATP-binding protein n=1 Tax=Halochromatium roseum TaxID=391920 RepID=UPI00191295BF|nr:ATP-binding protein [Halochromatium roseum]MBK5941733.1 AAA family ATPase [Halochromatium roseum]